VTDGAKRPERNRPIPSFLPSISFFLLSLSLSLSLSFFLPREKKNIKSNQNVSRVQKKKEVEGGGRRRTTCSTNVSPTFKKRRRRGKCGGKDMEKMAVL